ncbi:hypothetical protein BJV78DRAFT_1119819, partial [Lactifluus subvellereus]
ARPVWYESVVVAGWMHTRFVLHRDIKLESAYTSLVKLTDFRLARKLDPDIVWVSTPCGSKLYTVLQLLVAAHTDELPHPTLHFLARHLMRNVHPLPPQPRNRNHAQHGDPHLLCVRDGHVGARCSRLYTHGPRTTVLQLRSALGTRRAPSGWGGAYVQVARAAGSSLYLSLLQLGHQSGG